MLRRPTVPLRSFVLSLRSLQTEATRKPILLDIQGPKACITLNNAKIGNALDVDLQKELIAMITDLGQRTEVRAIVLTGTGKFFCTGMNLGSKGESLTGNNEEQHDRLKLFFEKVADSVKPVIAVINGPCYGGGNGLAMACDFRIAAHPDVTFTLSEAKLGVSPATISKYIVREWGPSKAREAMLTCRPITAAELLPLAGVHYITNTQEEALQQADKLVEMLTGNAPHAMATCKHLVKTAAGDVEHKTDDAARSAFLEMMRPSMEAKYGIEQFRAKAKPDWAKLYREAVNSKL